MDSKRVNVHLRQSIRPLLRDHGFSAFSTRSSWRYINQRIDVVNFQSFSSHHAARIGCTTYSFAVNLGCYFCWIPEQVEGSVKCSKVGRPEPSEAHCHFRRSLRKRIVQRELERPDVWYVSEEGQDVPKVVHDARMVIFHDAFPWFRRFDDMAEVVRTLREDIDDIEGTWGSGNNPSPRRHYQLGYTLLALGNHQEARTHLQEALASGCYEYARGSIEGLLNRPGGAPSGSG